MYLPLAAVLTGLAAGGYAAGRRALDRGLVSLRAAQVAGGCLAALVVIAFVLLTLRRNADYASDLSLWQDTAAKAPNNVRAHFNLGSSLLARGKADEAVARYERALELAPNDAAICHSLGKALAKQGEFEKAIAEFRKVLQRMPDHVEAHVNLGDALAKLGQCDEAMDHYRMAIELKPDHAKARDGLAMSLAARGRTDEAIAQYRRALAIKPDLVEANNDLARLLATSPEASLRNGGEAVALAQRAVAFSSSPEPLILDTLAAAYAEAGRFPDAVRTAQQAADLAAQQNQPALAESIQARIRLYRAGTPYRQK